MAENKTYKAVQLQSDHTLKVAEVEIPHIKSDDHILIKVEAAVINPHDIVYIRAKHLPRPSYPDGVVSDGSGTVVEVGKNHSSRIKVGDRVSFSHVTNLGHGDNTLLFLERKCSIFTLTTLSKKLLLTSRTQ